MGGVTATAAFECAAKVCPVIGVVASVESILPASIVGATTATAVAPVGLGSVVGHVGRLMLNVPDWFAVGIVACMQGGLVAKCITQH